MTAKSCHQTQDRRGQATVEFALCFAIVMLILVGSFEAARYSSLSLRLSSAVREVSRMIVAEQIDPNPTRTTAANQATMASQLATSVFPFIDGMISPADLQNQGKVWVTYLTRVPSAVASEQNDPTKDRVVVSYQFYFPAASNDGVRAGWNSKFGTPGTVVNPNRVPKDGLARGETTVAVEIYHQTNFIFPEAMLSSIKLDKIYDMAIF